VRKGKAFINVNFSSQHRHQFIAGIIDKKKTTKEIGESCFIIA
jgi:hypothetical protein